MECAPRWTVSPLPIDFDDPIDDRCFIRCVIFLEFFLFSSLLVHQGGEAPRWFEPGRNREFRGGPAGGWATGRGLYL